MERLRRLVVACIAVGFLTLVGYSLTNKSSFFAFDGSVPAVQAVTAKSFINSVGMNIHGYWWSPSETTTYLNALKSLDIHYVRDGFTNGYDDFRSHNEYGGGWIERLQQFKTQGNISASLTAQELITPPADVVNYVKWLNQTPGTVADIEGPNEVDAQCYSNPQQQPPTFTGNIWYPCPDDAWRPRTERYVTSLHDALGADNATKNTVIYSPSIDPVSAHGSNVFANTSNYANLHFYPYLAGDTQKTLAQVVAAAAPTYPGKPIAMTEIGYPSEPGNNSRGANEQLQSILLPAYLLENYKLGVSRTFLYQLVDDPNYQDYNGIFRGTQAKPAFYTLQKLMSTINDSSTDGFTPGKLRYQLQGDSVGVSSLLLEKADGTFEIAIWQSTLTNSPTPLPGQIIPPKNLSVKFGDDLEQATTYDVAVNGGGVVTAAPTSLSVTLNSAPVVVEVKLASANNNQNTSQSNGGSSGSSSSTNSNQSKNSSSKGKKSTSSKSSGGATQTQPTTPNNNSSANNGFTLPNTAPPVPLSFWERVVQFIQSVYGRVIGIL